MHALKFGDPDCYQCCVPAFPLLRAQRRIVTDVKVFEALRQAQDDTAREGPSAWLGVAATALQEQPVSLKLEDTLLLRIFALGRDAEHHLASEMESGE